MKNSISECSKCKKVSTPRRWSCVKCGIVPQRDCLNLEGTVIATSDIVKSPKSETKQLTQVSLSFSDSSVYFLSK
jgi:uncharacterized OB-fold protein